MENTQIEVGVASRLSWTSPGLIVPSFFSSSGNCHCLHLKNPFSYVTQVDWSRKGDFAPVEQSQLESSSGVFETRT